MPHISVVLLRSFFCISCQMQQRHRMVRFPGVWLETPSEAASRTPRSPGGQLIRFYTNMVKTHG